MPEDLGDSEIESPVNVEARKRGFRTRWLFVLVLFLILAGLAYFISLKKSEKQILIVETNGQVAVMGGEVTFRNRGDTLEPIIVLKGRLILFRKEDTLSGVTAKAGEVYRWDENLNLRKVGEFDLNKSNEQLAKEYGIGAK